MREAGFTLLEMLIAMTLLVMVGIKQKKKARFVAWESIAMIGFYLAGLFSLYKG